MYIKTYKEALEKIFVLETTKDYSLEKVKKAMKLLNNPLKNIKVIHIAGTNWKWSVCNMVFSVLKQANKKVWIFASPHLVDLKERFRTQDGEISEKDFVDILNKILKLPLKLSFFEICFLIAVLYFEKKGVEYAIFEVGMWGLLDSTNVVNPVVTAITSIWLDHTHILWNSLDEISYQKAGIIKENIPIVYNHKNEIIEKIAKQKNAPIIFTTKRIKTNLIWDFQEKNAGIAYEICKYLNIDEKTILNWLQNVKHSWRLQYISSNLLIDGAHNRDGLLELKKYLEKIKWNFDNIKLCFALKKWKEANLIFEIFWKKDYILVDSSNKLMVEDSRNLKNKINFDVEIKTPHKIMQQAQKEKNNLFVVFWSLYMIGEFLI